MRNIHAQLRLLCESGTAVDDKQLLVGSGVKLSEAGIGKDGTVELCIITPGWGSSGYYSESVLKEAAPLMAAGTHNYWDHPTVSEEWQRPERSLRDLAGVLVSEAGWQDSGWNGPGVYAKGKVFGDYQEALNEMAPYIGVSLMAFGISHHGEAEGDSGEIIDKIVAVRSADYVTLPGRGGAIKESVKNRFESFKLSVSDKPAPQKEREEEHNLDEAQKLREAEDKVRQLEQQVATLTTERDTAVQERDAAREENTRFREAAILGDAARIVREALKAEKYEALPDMVRERLTVDLSKNPPLEDGKLDKEKLTARIEAGVKKELEYIASITGGSAAVTGLGESRSLESILGVDPVVVDDAGDTTKVAESLTAVFGDLGLSENAAKIAAAGR